MTPPTPSAPIPIGERGAVVLESLFSIPIEDGERSIAIVRCLGEIPRHASGRPATIRVAEALAQHGYPVRVTGWYGQNGQPHGLPAQTRECVSGTTTRLVIEQDVTKRLPSFS